MHEFGHDDGRERREPTHRQLAAHLVADVGGGRIQAIGLLQQLFRIAQQRAARRGQRQTLRMVAQKQLHVQFAFDVRNRGGDRGLGDIGALRCQR